MLRMWYAIKWLFQTYQEENVAKKRLPGKFKSYLLYGPSACCSTQQPGDVAEMPRTPGQSAEINDGDIGVETEWCPDAEMLHTAGQSAETDAGEIGVETQFVLL